MYKYAKDMCVMLLGTFLIAAALNFFVKPSHLADGGVTGIVLLISYLFRGIDLGLLISLFNIPILVLSYKFLGLKNTIYSTIGVISLSLMVKTTEGLVADPITRDIFLNCLLAGVVSGIGLGIIFRIGGTTGGIDIIVRIVNKYFGWSNGSIIFAIDLVIIVSAIFIVGIDMAIYTLLYIFVSTKVIDFVVEGVRRSKTALIISKDSKALAKKITTRMNRGVTILKGQGGYTGEDKDILYVTLALTELPKLKTIILENDNDERNTFLVVGDAHEVLGKGFSYR